MSEHVGDLAERYALGDLEPSDVASVDEHIATCAPCLRLVGEAEETMLALERGDSSVFVPALLDQRLLLPAPKSRPRTFRFMAFAGAIAAGLVIGIFSTLLAFSLRTNDMQGAPLIAMIHSHFNHAQFAPAGVASAPAAKVIYARDRSWLYVVADGSERYAVYAVSGTSSQRLGELQPSGTTSSLFVNVRFGEGTIELRDGKTVVAHAQVR